jgi:cytochrome c-type biogenesis protein CcmH
MRWLLVLTLLLLPVMPAGAVLPDEVLDNPVLEARARDISKELRCLVCQNQSIDESDASLARDLRLLVRERLTNGDSDRQVVDYIVARYGEFVLLRPFFGWHTIILWLTAPTVLLIAIGALVLSLRWRRAAATALAVATGSDAKGNGVAMTPQEKAALDTLKQEPDKSR